LLWIGQLPVFGALVTGSPDPSGTGSRAPDRRPLRGKLAGAGSGRHLVRESVSAPRDRRSSWRRADRQVARALQAVAVVVIGGWALYFVGAQAFLCTPLLRRLVNAESPAIHLEYRSAWSAWPRRVPAARLRPPREDRG